MMTVQTSHAAPITGERRQVNTTLAHKYLSAGEALSWAALFEKARDQLSLKFKTRLKLLSVLTKVKQLFQRSDQMATLPQAKCPDFDQLLTATGNLSSEEYDTAQKKFGIDFRPNYLSKNSKLEREIVHYKNVSSFIAKADLAAVNPKLLAKRNRQINLDLRRNLLDFKTKLYSIDDKYSFQISAACIINNEARFLKEWLDFHQLVGIEHFFLFNNGSTDEYLDVLAPYINRGIVDIINWNTGDSVGDDWVYIEAEALSCALRLCHGRSKWLALIDTDEYLFPVQGDSLNQALAEFEPYGSVSVRYTVFGTNSVQRIPSDRLLIETLTKSCVDSAQHNKLFKSVVRPEFVDSCINSHYCELMPGFINITENFEPLNPQTIGNVQNKKLAINHYWTRDLDYFRAHKLPRLTNWGILEDQSMRNIAELSAVERSDILRFVPKLKELKRS